jgi:hypothetical protein
MNFEDITKLFNENGCHIGEKQLKVFFKLLDIDGRYECMQIRSSSRRGKCWASSSSLATTGR